jgi:hypothetical protein
MKNKKLQALVEEMLGTAAAEPVHGDEAAKEHTPELSNKDILVGQHAEEVEEVIVEGEDMDGEESHVDEGEYDYEGDMAKSQLRTILDAAQELHDQLGDEDNLPEWVQSKITLAKEYVDTARDYMKSEGQESVQESYTEEELLELFESLNLDTDKYTFEYLAEELGFVNEGLFDGFKRGIENYKAQKDASKLAKTQMKAKLIKDRMNVGSAERNLLQSKRIYKPTVKAARLDAKLDTKLDAIDTKKEVSKVRNDKAVERQNTGLAKQVKKTDSYTPSQVNASVEYTREELEALFESLELDTNKYTFEYLAEELGFEPLSETKLSPGYKKTIKKEYGKQSPYFIQRAEKGDNNFNNTNWQAKNSFKLSNMAKDVKTTGQYKDWDNKPKKVDPSDINSTAENFKKRSEEMAAAEEERKQASGILPYGLRKSPKPTNESYTEEELVELFESLNLDTEKYTFNYLAEQLGFAAAEPIATSDAEPKVLKISLGNKEVYGGDSHEQAEEIEEVLVEGMRGRPSNKSKRVSPKGSTVMGSDGKLEVIKKLQKKA